MMTQKGSAYIKTFGTLYGVGPHVYCIFTTVTVSEFRNVGLWADRKRSVHLLYAVDINQIILATRSTLQSLKCRQSAINQRSGSNRLTAIGPRCRRQTYHCPNYGRIILHTAGACLQGVRRILNMRGGGNAAPGQRRQIRNAESHIDPWLFGY